MKSKLKQAAESVVMLVEEVAVVFKDVWRAANCPTRHAYEKEIHLDPISGTDGVPVAVVVYACPDCMNSFVVMEKWAQ